MPATGSVWRIGWRQKALTDDASQPHIDGRFCKKPGAFGN